jgi:hypothetical protein
MALTLEWLAHAALHGNPGLAFHGFNELRVFRGVKLRADQSRNLRFLAGKARKDNGLFLVPVEMHGPGKEGHDLVHARAEIVLVNRLPEARESRPMIAGAPFQRKLADVYDELLFHGPELQAIEQIITCVPEGVVAELAVAPAPATWMHQPLRQAWLTDPLALDGSFQLVVLWSAETRAAASLPCHVGQYRQYRRSFPGNGVRAVVTITHASEHSALADIDYLDAAGRLVARMTDYECVIDSSLNQAFRRNRLPEDALPAS